MELLKYYGRSRRTDLFGRQVNVTGIQVHLHCPDLAKNGSRTANMSKFHAKASEALLVGDVQDLFMTHRGLARLPEVQLLPFKRRTSPREENAVLMGVMRKRVIVRDDSSRRSRDRMDETTSSIPGLNTWRNLDCCVVCQHVMTIAGHHDAVVVVVTSNLRDC